MLTVLRATLRLSNDGFVAYNFLNVFRYLYLRKLDTIEGELTSYNKIVIAAALFESGVFVSCSLISNILNIVFNSGFSPYRRENSPVLYFIQKEFGDMLDLVLNLGLLYLFYYQAKEENQEKRHSSSIYRELMRTMTPQAQIINLSHSGSMESNVTFDKSEEPDSVFLKCLERAIVAGHLHARRSGSEENYSITS